MLRIAIGLLAALVGTAAVAEDKKAEGKLSGTWVREAEGFEVKFTFLKDDKLKLTLDNGGNGLVVSADYKVDADGKLTATITGAEKKGDFPVLPKAGDKFSMKLKVNGKTATVTDFEADENEGAKNIFEGDYKLKYKDD